jgi:hypothetical protein
MQRVFSFRQGDRSEYLAQYILSSLAISVPVPRQEDVGSDFHCTLLRKEGQNLRPYLPFNIQIKSISDKVVSFGGLTDAGYWREHEIDQLCQTDTPFLIGMVDIRNQRLDIFSTLTRYFVASKWGNSPKPRQVDLVPYEPAANEHLGEGTQEDLPEIKPGIPNKLWRLPIGQPIVSILIGDSEDPVKCEEIKRVLEPYLRLDQDNAVFSRLGLGHFHWPVLIQPGKFSDQRGICYSFGPPVNNPAFDKQMRTLCNIMASILSTFKLTKMKDEVRLWLPIIERIVLSELDPLTQQIFRDAIAYAEQPD